MLANPYTKFTPFEKKALCAFGCTDQESDRPSPDKCINISITTDQLVRLVNGIKGVKRKKADFHSPIGKTAIFSSPRRITPHLGLLQIENRQKRQFVNRRKFTENGPLEKTVRFWR